MWQIKIGEAIVNTTSIPGMAATAAYLAVAIGVMARENRFTVKKASVIALIVLPSLATTSPVPSGNGWMLVPATTSTVALFVFLSAIMAQYLSLFFSPARWGRRVDATLSGFEWPEMLLSLTLANAIGDFYGAIHFSSPSHPGRIGGVGFFDGLVIFPILLTLFYGFTRKWFRREVRFL